MPFQAIHFQTEITTKMKKRKETTLLTHLQTNTPHTNSERASAFPSAKASITIEAALAVPIFFFAVVCMIYLLEIQAIQTTVRNGAQYACQKAVKEAYLIPAVMPGSLETDMVEAIGAERLNRSIIIGGSAGLQCYESRMSPKTAVLDFVVCYKVKIPLPVFHIAPLSYRHEMKVKGWTGYEKTGFVNKSEKTVYVTETGLVYHKNNHCTYLDLSIRMVDSSQIKDLRNESQGKYKPCVRCGGSGNEVYITNTGDRYHSSLSCSGLKRSVYAIPLSEVLGKNACSRCG